VSALVGLLLVFLVILIVRYALLLWLGYLHHIESRASGDTDAPQPAVTIIVPVHNEAVVVESALRSLLELDYPEYDVIVVDDGSTDASCASSPRRTAAKRARSMPESRWRARPSCCAWTATRDSRATRSARECATSPTRASARSPGT
jgi:hypothetical protein